MPKVWTEEERKAFGEKMKASRKKKETEKAQATPSADNQGEQNLDELRQMIKEANETIAQLKAWNALKTTPDMSVSRTGSLVGEVERYLIDANRYPNPRDRLMKEPRLMNIAFPYNYEVEYEVGVSRYENINGVRMKEPKFNVTLHRIILDDDGQQTNQRYIARKLVFHEDPDAALVIARDNGFEVDSTDEQTFLNEMRYLRVRDWLFGIFWPKPSQAMKNKHETVIGNQLVEVYEVNTEDLETVPFEQLKG